MASMRVSFTLKRRKVAKRMWNVRSIDLSPLTTSLPSTIYLHNSRSSSLFPRGRTQVTLGEFFLKLHHHQKHFSPSGNKWIVFNLLTRGGGASICIPCREEARVLKLCYHLLTHTHASPRLGLCIVLLQGYLLLSSCPLLRVSFSAALKASVFRKGKLLYTDQEVMIMNTARISSANIFPPAATKTTWGKKLRRQEQQQPLSPPADPEHISHEGKKLVSPTPKPQGVSSETNTFKLL